MKNLFLFSVFNLRHSSYKVSARSFMTVAIDHRSFSQYQSSAYFVWFHPLKVIDNTKPCESKNETGNSHEVRIFQDLGTF